MWSLMKSVAKCTTHRDVQPLGTLMILERRLCSLLTVIHKYVNDNTISPILVLDSMREPSQYFAHGISRMIFNKYSEQQRLENIQSKLVLSDQFKHHRVAIF